MKESHNVQAVHHFVNNQHRDIQKTGAWLKWKLDQKQRTLLKEMAGLVTRLVRIAHHSQVLHELGDRVTKILEEASQASTIEGMLMASTLMGSLESEVRNKLSREAAPANRMLLRCKSCTEATKSNPTAIPRHESISEADWMEAPKMQTTGPEDSEMTNIPAAVCGEKTVVVEANTFIRQEEVEAEAGQGEEIFQSLSGEDSDGGVSEELPTIGRELTWPLQCMVTMGEGRQGKICWEDGRVHAYALANNDKAIHLLLQVRTVSMYFFMSVFFACSYLVFFCF